MQGGIPNHITPIDSSRLQSTLVGPLFEFLQFQRKRLFKGAKPASAEKPSDLRLCVMPVPEVTSNSPVQAIVFFR